jgi:hypothetical protein
MLLLANCKVRGVNLNSSRFDKGPTIFSPASPVFLPASVSAAGVLPREKGSRPEALLSPRQLLVFLARHARSLLIQIFTAITRHGRRRLQGQCCRDYD